MAGKDFGALALQDKIPRRVQIAVPCRDMMPTATARSIAATVKAGYDVVFSTGGGLPNARNEICRSAIQEGYDAVLQIDSDMVWVPEHVAELVRAAGEFNMYNQETCIVSGRYYSRSPPHVAHAYVNGKSIHGGKTPRRDEFLHADYTGAGFLYIPTRAMRLIPEPWFDHSEKQGEDAYFCLKAAQHGVHTFLYPFVTVGHVGTTMYSDPQYEGVMRK